MTDNKQELRYEELYDQLVERANALHESNKKRIRVGIIFLLILPAILGVILMLTHSDKVVFLIIWIIIMFAVSAYLISVEYVDDAIQKTLTDVTKREAEFDKLLPDPEPVQAALRERIAERRAARNTGFVDSAEIAKGAEGAESEDVL